MTPSFLFSEVRVPLRCKSVSYAIVTAVSVLGLSIEISLTVTSPSALTLQTGVTLSLVAKFSTM